jgi:hypothetical protein
MFLFKKKDNEKTKTTSSGFNDRTAALLRTASSLDKQGLFKLLESEDGGLDIEEVEKKLETLGANEVTHYCRLL